MVVQNKQKETVRMIMIHIVFIVIGLLCLIPFITVVTISVSNEQHINDFGYSILPKTIDFSAYQYIFKNPSQITNAYIVSIIVTVLGTIAGVTIMSMASYCLARKNFKLRKQFMFYIFFTMLFSGGMVPSYILITQYLKLGDTISVLIVPTLVNVFHIVLLRTFLQKLPVSLFESAKIDGANELVIYLKIALPLSTPSLATVALLSSLGKWNDWYTPLLYIKNDSLIPLQYMLYKMMADLQFVANNFHNVPDNMLNTQLLPSESARMAMCVLAAGPMLLVFPFFQKYFVRGLTVGSIKE